jgi:hypothetical protein
VNKKLIQELLSDRETRMLISNDFASALAEAHSKPDLFVFDEIMCSTLKKLNNRPIKGEVITIEVSDYMWVRGEYVRTRDDGKVAVIVPGLPGNYTGERVDLTTTRTESET